MKILIETSCRENYAAHNGFTGEYAWKNKPGSYYMVEGSTMEEVKREVAPLIDEEPNDVHFEYIDSITEVEDDHKSWFQKSQEEYDEDGWDTLYLDSVIRKGRNGHWYLKRGYIAGMFNKDCPEFAHLAGKFIGWVDDLTTGKCVLKIEDTKRTPITKEAA